MYINSVQLFYVHKREVETEKTKMRRDRLNDR